MDRLPPRAYRQPRLSLGGYCWGLLLLLPCLWACSPRTTTPQSQLWQGFVTRYNTLYHAQEAYADAYQRLLTTTVDDYSRPLPLDPLVYVLEDGQERASFSRTLEKTRKAIAQHSMVRKPARRPGWRRDPRAVALQARTEYNPALREAWLLTVRALFYAAKLDEARLTAESLLLRYATEPEVREEARLWAVRSLTLLGRYAEAEELLSLFPQDATTAKLRRGYLYVASRAELALGQGLHEQALPDLQLAAQRAKDKPQRARLYYLLGQTYRQLGREDEARHAFEEAARLSDAPRLELASRLSTLALDARSDQARTQLRRLATSRRYAQEQDQIFLALGQSFLLSQRPPEAEQAFRQAIDSARQHGTAWGEAQLELGALALATDRYPEAFTHFTQASSALSPRHPRHSQVVRLLPGLQLLAPPAQRFRRADSLLRVARLPEGERLRHIDSLIRRQREAQAQGQAPASTSSPQLPPTHLPAGSSSTGFYFADSQRVAQGKRLFLQRWGDRPLTDDWNRSQRALTDATDAPSPDSLPSDSLPQPTLVARAEEDPLSRAFYLRDLPQSPEAVGRMREEAATALLQQADLLSEKLDLPDHAQRSYLRLLRDYPEARQRETALSRSLLLALRRGDRPTADSLRTQLLSAFPRTPLAPLLRPANYPDILRQHHHIPERLYQQAWTAYQRGDLPRTARALDSLYRLPLIPEDLAPKARLLQLLSATRPGAETQLAGDLRQLREAYPTSEVMPYVESLLSGLESGRPLRGLPLQQSSLVPASTPTTEVATDSVHFDPVPAGSPRDLLVLYPRGAGQRHEVYFALMTYLFSHFTQWSLEALPLEGFARWDGFRLQGFRDEEALQTFLRAARGAEGLLPDLPAGAELLPVYRAHLPQLTDESLPSYPR